MSIEEDEENGIRRYTISMKVDGKIRKYENVAVRRERKLNSFQLLTVDYELIDLPKVDWMFNHTLFDQQWENIIRKSLVASK